MEASSWWGLTLERDEDVAGSATSHDAVDGAVMAPHNSHALLENCLTDSLCL